MGSLGEETSTTATIFSLLMKEHPYFKHYNVYFPNAYDKSTCDPNWTDIKHPCRGTFDTCLMPEQFKTGLPIERKSCWRYSFRYQLERAFIMVQISEYYYVGEEENEKAKHIT